MSNTGGFVGGIVGAVIGFMVGGPAGAAWGWSLGAMADNLLSDGPHGPRLDDLKPQASEYGRPIPIVYSVMAVGGNVIWASDLVEHDDGEQSTYTASFAVLICESDGNHSLGKIWAGPERRLVYDPANNTAESGTVTFYNGAEDQLPDPLMEAALGVGNVPAYRGYAYVVIQDFNVSAHDGNRIPFLTIEVGQEGTSAPENLGQFWSPRILDGGDSFITVYWGSYFGVLKHRKSDIGLVHNRLIGGGENWQPTDIALYDSANDLVVIAKGGANSLSTRLYAVQEMEGAGAFSSHLPFAIPAGYTLKGACIANNLLVFAFAIASGGTAFYSVNPATNTQVGSAQIFDTGASDTLLPNSLQSPADASSWVYGVTGSNVRVYTLDGAASSSASVGTTPTGYTGGLGAMADPDTSLLWISGVASGTLYWRVYSNTTTVYASSKANPFFFLANQPWVFMPATDDHLGSVWLVGSRWLDVDHYQYFDPDTGIDTIPDQDGAYSGAQVPQGVIYNSAQDNVWMVRENAFWNQAPIPPSIPYDGHGYLGGADSGLSYQTLAQIVTDLCERAGLEASDIDVTALTDTVHGYTIANQTTVKDAIAKLMPAYYFDAVESQGILKFVKRGGEIVVAIDADDLGAHPSDQENPLNLYEVTRVMDEELPQTFSVTYLLAATKYSAATKYARRLVGFSGDEASADFPMVFTDQKGQEVAQVNLHNQWVERLQYKFTLPREFSYLEPTDLIGIDGKVVRITSMKQRDGGFHECEAVRDDADTYTPNVIVEETPPPDESVSTSPPTLLELM